MKRKCLVSAALVFVFGLGFYPYSIHAQGPAKALSLVYSNNLNGEFDPCPT